MDLERFNRADSLRNAGRLQESLQEFRELEALTPDLVEKAAVLLNESGVLAEMGRYNEVHGKAQEAISLSPTPEVQCNALVARAGAFRLAGDRDGALASLDHALIEYPNVLRREEFRFLYEKIQVRRGVLLVQLERLSQAKTVLEECLSFELSPDNRWKVIYDLARCYFDLGDNNRAKQMFLDFLKEQGDAVHIVSAHHLLGAIYYKEGAYHKALAEFTWCLPNADDAGMPKPIIYGWLANTYRALGNLTEAERYSALAKGT